MPRTLHGARPPQIDEKVWGHTRRIYKLYGGNALWLTSAGLHKTRPLALMHAILNAVNDAPRIDTNPIGAPANSPRAAHQAHPPTSAPRPRAAGRADPAHHPELPPSPH